MSVEDDIKIKLQDALHPQWLDVINESHQHNVPPGSESHFKVVIVSDAFKDKMLVARHRMINKILAEELQAVIHALALHTLTPEEWHEKGEAPASPACMGGGK